MLRRIPYFLAACRRLIERGSMAVRSVRLVLVSAVVASCAIAGLVPIALAGGGANPASGPQQPQAGNPGVSSARPQDLSGPLPRQCQLPRTGRWLSRRWNSYGPRESSPEKARRRSTERTLGARVTHRHGEIPERSVRRHAAPGSQSVR